MSAACYVLYNSKFQAASKPPDCFLLLLVIRFRAISSCPVGVYSPFDHWCLRLLVLLQQCVRLLAQTSTDLKAEQETCVSVSYPLRDRSFLPHSCPPPVTHPVFLPLPTVVDDAGCMTETHFCRSSEVVSRISPLFLSRHPLPAHSGMQKAWCRMKIVRASTWVRTRFLFCSQVRCLIHLTSDVYFGRKRLGEFDPLAKGANCRIRECLLPSARIFVCQGSYWWHGNCCTRKQMARQREQLARQQEVTVSACHNRFGGE